MSVKNSFNSLFEYTDSSFIFRQIWIGESDVLHVDSLFEYTDSYFINEKFVSEAK